MIKFQLRTVLGLPKLVTFLQKKYTKLGKIDITKIGILRQ